MLKKILQICSAALLAVSTSVQAAGPPDLLYYTDCLADNDRTTVRLNRAFCDDNATGEEYNNLYNVGIFRPRNPTDPPGYGYVDCPESHTQYACLGAPSKECPHAGGYGDPYGPCPPYSNE